MRGPTRAVCCVLASAALLVLAHLLASAGHSPRSELAPVAPAPPPASRAFPTGQAARLLAASRELSSYTVAPGDTLSSIAAGQLGTADGWPALWWANRAQVPDPSLLLPGTVLTLTGLPAGSPQLLAQALEAVPPPSPPPAPAPGPVAGPVAAPSVSPVVATASGGGFQQCVISAESGGDPSAVNPASGAGGLYGFLPSTWESLGYSGLPEDAPVATQNAAFAAEYAQAGTAPWAGDGCA